MGSLAEGLSLMGLRSDPSFTRIEFTLETTMPPSTVPHIVRPKEVRNHLTHAALGQSAACMTASFQRVAGTFSAPDNGGRVMFYGRSAVGGPDQGIDIGQSVRVDYRYHRTNLVFFSRISELFAPGSWILDRPRTVQRLSRRIEPRIAVSEGAALSVAMMTTGGFSSYPVVDLSTGGLAVRYDARDVGLWVGRRVTVWLELLDQQPVPVNTEVRHVSRRGCQPGFKLAGLRFVEPDAESKRIIEASLAQL